MTTARPGAAGERRRSTTLRLAAVHLRAGLHQLARAELEMLDARGELASTGLADLAEARWRAGDLAGAEVAAEAHLAAGGRAAIAIVVAAEGAAVSGRNDEARAHVASLADLQAVDLEALFAGMPQLAPWPTSAAVVGPVAGVAPAVDRPPAETAPDATELIVRARADLATSEPRAVTAALARLALVLRLEPRLAGEVLAALARQTEPTALLVRGDALRILGRRPDAEAAYAAAAAAMDRPTAGRRVRARRAQGPDA